MERVPCEPDPKCKFHRKDGCYQNLHHLFYPRRDYTTPLEKKFRIDPRNIVQLCRREHERLHHTQDIPEKPTIQEMQVFIRDKKMERVRDYDGRSQRRAEQIQEVVGHLGQMTAKPVFSVEQVPDVAGRDVVIERPDAAQLNKTAGWSPDGTWLGA